MKSSTKDYFLNYRNIKATMDNIVALIYSSLLVVSSCAWFSFSIASTFFSFLSLNLKRAKAYIIVIIIENSIKIVVSLKKPIVEGKINEITNGGKAIFGSLIKYLYANAPNKAA